MGRIVPSVRVGGERWQQVDSLDASGPEDRHFVASTDDDGALTLRFGDGIRGRRRPTGEAVISIDDAAGSGAAGNVADDMAQSMIDALAAAGDALSRAQDEIAEESHLATDRIRGSIGRLQESVSGRAAQTTDPETPLERLVESVGRELEHLARDIERVYDEAFVETADDSIRRFPGRGGIVREWTLTTDDDAWRLSVTGRRRPRRRRDP